MTPAERKIALRSHRSPKKQEKNAHPELQPTQRNALQGGTKK